MSLNRCEQRIEDYLQSHKEERQFWQAKVRTIVAGETELSKAASRIEIELWRYYVERSGVVPSFKQAVLHEGSARTSLRNLAELMIRLWTEPRKKPKPRVEIPGELFPDIT